MPFTRTSMLLVFLATFSAFTSAQGLNQNQTCANACTAAQACDHQCDSGTTYNLDTNYDIYVDCLCQSGCLCNAEICLQCCEAAGDNGADSDSCPFIQLAAGNVLLVCSIVSLPSSFSYERNKPRGEMRLAIYPNNLYVSYMLIKGWYNARKSNTRKRLFRIW